MCAGGRQNSTPAGFFLPDLCKIGSHNTGKGNGNEGYIIRLIMLTNVTISTIYGVEMGEKPQIKVERFT